MRGAFLLAGVLATSALPTQGRELRVCADPNNLPFSNEKGEGFENKVIDLIGKDLGATVTYTWWAQRRGYVRNTLNSVKCDLWPGVASAVGMLATTHPYYRSTYVFVTRPDRGLDIASFDDPRLKELRIGLQMIGNDAMNTPPAHALARRGITQNVRGYMVYGDYSRANPTAGIIDAVANREIDIAIVWGPIAGYFGERQSPALVLRPVTAAVDGPQWPMQFDISMGVRHNDEDFRREIEAALARNRIAIDKILADYGVPRVAPPAQTGAIDRP
ncbi:MAG: substrate-binding domain-containing protein [Methylobacteriaceae bacterium]|nr:substrate-binding domain-containing protein [Methylobacteriaceae bacterium]